MNLYLKHRPQTFDQVVGQDQAVSIIKNAIQNKNNPHAYLLTGTRGTGKTTIGRLIAKALNCPAFGCGHCNICLGIQEGTFPDLYEIDAASNRGIENIRQLKDQVSYAPQYRYKVYIIDECHMLTKEASNALLKVLEEPPAGVVFVLCTTEEDKILPTIKSRCQVHALPLVSIENLALNLLGICVKEGIDLDTETANFLALKAKGSVRDSISLLDKFRSIEGGLTIQNIKNQFLDSDQIENFMVLLAEKDIGQLFVLIDNIVAGGANLEAFISEVEEFLQNVNYKIAKFDNSTYNSYPLVNKIYNKFSTAFLLQCFDSLSKWRNRFIPLSRINLEVAVTEICLFQAVQTQNLGLKTSPDMPAQDSMPMDWMTIKKAEPQVKKVDTVTVKDEDDF